MFDPDSRYDKLPTLVFITADGREIGYVTRRFLPRAESMQTLLELSVARGDRLDLIAARTLGDPLRFYQICDANEAMHPDELTEEPGRRLRIALPEP